MPTTTTFSAANAACRNWGRFGSGTYSGSPYVVFSATGSQVMLRVFGKGLRIKCNDAGVTTNGLRASVDGVTVTVTTTGTVGYSDDIFATAGISTDGWHDVVVWAHPALAGSIWLMEPDTFEVTATGTPAVDVHSAQTGYTVTRILGASAFTNTGAHTYHGASSDSSYTSPSMLHQRVATGTAGIGNGSSFRFKATCSEIGVWASDGGYYYSVFVDGIEIGQYQMPNAGAMAIITIAGLDNGAEHEYEISGMPIVDQVAVKGSFSASAVAVRSKVTFIGDSVTNWQYLNNTAAGTGYGPLAAAAVGFDLYDTAIAGYTTKNNYDQFDTDVLPFAADVVVIYNGYNDASEPTGALVDTGAIGSTANQAGITKFTQLLNKALALSGTVRVLVFKPFQHSLNATLWANLWSIRLAAIAACNDPTRVSTLVTDSLRSSPSDGVHDTPMGYTGNLGDHCGAISLTGQPSNGDTITITPTSGSPYTITFGTEVAVGANVTATAQALFVWLYANHPTHVFENIKLGGVVNTSPTSERGVGVRATSLAKSGANITVYQPLTDGFIEAARNALDTTAPTVTNVTSSTANGTYGTTPISIDVVFSEPVTVVSGTPTLFLNTGGTASYGSGSGTNTLKFDYSITSGDNADPLDYVDSASLIGGVIEDLGGNTLVRTLPDPGDPGSLSANKTIVIDTLPPTVTSAAIPADNAYVIDVTISEAIDADTVSGLLAWTTGTGAHPSDIELTAATNIRLTFDAAFAGGTSPTISYSNAAANIADPAGNELVSASGVAVTNNVPGGAGGGNRFRRHRGRCHRGRVSR